MSSPAAMLVILILTAAASLSLLLLEPASASRHPAPRYSSSPTQGGGGVKDQEEKVRLGSSPPSCRNKCYQCSPCGAVQVPSLAAPAGPAAATSTAAQDSPPVVPLSNNYKPLWWKCQCRDRLYDP